MKISIAVINDLATDQRVHRTCSLLHDMGYDTCLIGRKKRKSPAMPHRDYKYVRMKLLFEHGALFYAFFNIRLFFRLLFTSWDVVWANDLDTLLACRMASKIKRKKIIYDSHEYFTEVPELSGRKFVKKTWERIEGKIFPKLDFIITVNDSIAALYKKKYNKDLLVIRNVPISAKEIKIKTKQELALPENKHIFILQGSGINIDRGAEEALEAMQYIEDCILLIIGGGDVFPILHEILNKNTDLQKKVIIKNLMPREELISYTMNADIGLTLDKSNNINYLYSLPNKVFDYMQGGNAILGSDLPEVKNIVNTYQTGRAISNLSAQNIALVLNEMISDKKHLEIWKKNSILASKELCWENESKKLYEKLKIFLG